MVLSGLQQGKATFFPSFRAVSKIAHVSTSFSIEAYKSTSVLSESASDVEKTTVTAKSDASTEEKPNNGANNEVEFSKGSAPVLSETTSALQNTTLNSDYGVTTQESTEKTNDGGVKETSTKISTDKDGWINKWY